MSKEDISSNEQVKTLSSLNKVLHRLENVQAVVEQGLLPPLKEKRKILKARAKKLAQEPEKEERSEAYLEVVEFSLAYEKYAIESAYIREIYPLKELTPLPCVPRFVIGIINIRGKIISVIDIKKFFDLPGKGFSNQNKVIVVRIDDMELGILADDILGMRRIPLNEIQQSLPTLTGIREKYLKGVTNERLVVLDLAKIFLDKGIMVVEEVGM
jgi:purine-binding chemotaxis protein CheW